MVRLHVLAMARLAHRDGRKAREELFHQALVVGGEVLDDDERHTRAGRHRAEEALQGFKAPRGCSYAGDKWAFRSGVFHGESLISILLLEEATHPVATLEPDFSYAGVGLDSFA